MKKTVSNIEHQIQLKRDEIERYKDRIRNYPPERLKKYGLPHLEDLQTQLSILLSKQHDTHY